jgi:phosphopantothenoylcysteine decarboxylase
MTPQQPRHKVLYVIACGAPPARDVAKLVRLCQTAGWQVCVILTPSACAFTDLPLLEELTGYPVRSTYKQPQEPDMLPPPDAILVAPMTFNTANKWVLGIADTLALGLLTEAIGKHLPIVAIPSLNTAQAKHPTFDRNIDRLRAWGVSVLYGPDDFEPCEPDAGFDFVADYPWQRAVDALTAAAATAGPHPT